ncbi:MAG: hypothetical protein SGJ27_17870 [Candidatus Melainabacteria bacterium]|nr:hypothetical protein [Candidatus Melainabacteria bacterium]
MLSQTSRNGNDAEIGNDTFETENDAVGTWDVAVRTDDAVETGDDAHYLKMIIAKIRMMQLEISYDIKSALKTPAPHIMRNRLLRLSPCRDVVVGE